MADGELSDRRGLLCEPKLVEKRAYSGQDELPPQLVLEFFRELARNTRNLDLIELCSHVAKAKSKSSEEERVKLLQMVFHLGGHW